MTRRTERRSPCPIAFGLDVFGDRWTLLVIRDLVFTKKRTYGEFLDSPEGIATNILAQRLAWLEDLEIVSKSPDPDHGRRFVYQLTEKGLDLIPVLLEILAWSAKYDPHTPVSAEFAARIRKQRAAVLKEMRRKAGTAR